MKAGINKKDASNFFLYFSLPLIIVFILIFIIWYYIFQFLNKIYDFERISLFLECESIKKDIGMDMYSYLQENTDENEPVKEISIHAYSSSDSLISDYYQAFGLKADILILTGQDLVDTAEYIGDNFLEWDDNLLKKINLPNDFSFSFYSYNEKNYGLKIYDSNNLTYSNQIGFNDWLEFEKDDSELAETYYMVFNLYSDNIYPLVETSVTSNAFLAANFLFETFLKNSEE